MTMDEEKYEVILINDDPEENIPKLARAVVGCQQDSCWVDYGSCSVTDSCGFDFS